MSYQQRRLRSKKLLKQFLQQPSIKCWTDKTYLLRCTMASFSTLEVSSAERAYLDTRWQMLEDYLMCTSASQLAMKLEISKCSINFQPIDYIAIALGYCQQHQGGYLFEFPVIIEMVDNYSWFDDAFRNTKFLRMLVKSSMQNSICYLGRRAAPRKLLAHIVKKFPSVKKMSFMFTRHKNGKVEQKFTEEELAAWY